MSDESNSRIAEALDATKGLIADLDRRSRITEQLLTEIKGDLKQVSETAARLSTLVWTGNGNDSLITRVSLLERTVKEQAAQIKEAQAEQARFKARLLTAVVGLVGTLVTAAASFITALAK